MNVQPSTPLSARLNTAKSAKLSTPSSVRPSTPRSAPRRPRSSASPSTQKSAGRSKNRFAAATQSVPHNTSRSAPQLTREFVKMVGRKARKERVRSLSVKSRIIPPRRKLPLRKLSPCLLANYLNLPRTLLFPRNLTRRMYNWEKLLLTKERSELPASLL